MDEEIKKAYKSKHHKLLMWEWRLLVVVAVVGFLWLAIKLFLQSGLAIHNILVLGYFSIILIFDMIFFYDFLTDFHLAVTRQEITYHDMFGEVEFLWGDAKTIEPDFLGKYIKFVNWPTYRRNKKWAWFMQPDRWPIIGKSRLTNAIRIHDWERNEELMQVIKLCAPQVFETGKQIK